jgi:hypothetical protein
MTSTEMTPGAEAHQQGFEIIVNTRRHRVDTDTASYAQVVSIAFPDRPVNPNIYYEVTYRHAAGSKHEGTLLDGQSVEIKNGTNFHVTETDRS